VKTTPSNSFVAAGFGREFLWLDLANTLEWDGFSKLTDHLQNPAWLGLILHHWKIIEHLPHQVQHDEIGALRSLLRRLAEKLAAGTPLNAADLKALNTYLNVPAHQQLIQHQNGVRIELVPERIDWPWILSRFAASFADTLALDRPDRLKLCHNEGCKWIFYDQTKANTRIWCNDRTCGNRDRVRRARSKNKKAANTAA
jgi:predicted RNA-binding Zn ribbon-like protein